MEQYYERNLITFANEYFVECIKAFFGEEENKSVFHYTTTEVFSKIIENATFRASNVFYLNDSREYVNGIEILKEIIQQQKNKEIVINYLEELVGKISTSDGKSFPGLYTISFSKEQDSLHQWITYAKESGVAIELDYKLLQKGNNGEKWYLKQDIENETKAGFLDTSIIKPLKYLSKTSNIQNFIDAWSNVLNKMHEIPTETEKKAISEITLRMLASHIKNERFTSEAEIRIATFPMEIRENRTKLNYFPTKGILRPYIDISFGCEKNGEFIKMLPIKSIIVGPSGRQQTVFDSVVHRMIYGKRNVYQYGLEELSCNFKIYCKLIEDRFRKQFDQQDELIKLYWYEENKKHLCKDLKKDKFEIKKALGILDDISLTDEQKEFLHKVNNDFCFTKEGIIIQKSTTPYIF